MSTNRKVLLPIFFLLIAHSSCVSQKNVFVKNLLGKWKVSKWISLEDVNMNSASDYGIYVEDSIECTSILISIDTTGIITKPAGVCGFSPEKTKLLLDSVGVAKLVAETDFYRSFVGAELQHGMISQTLANLIGYKGKTVRMAITNYPIDWGDSSKMRILFLNAQRIVFYRGGDILLLTKVTD